MTDRVHSPEALRAFPSLSNCCASWEGGHCQRPQAKRRLCSLAALARRSLTQAALVQRLVTRITTQRNAHGLLSQGRRSTGLTLAFL